MTSIHAACILTGEMTKTVTSVEDLIAELGGVKATGDFFGVTSQMIVNWRDRHKALPSRRYPVQKRLLAERGIEAPLSLWSFDADESEAAA